MKEDDEAAEEEEEVEEKGVSCVDVFPIKTGSCGSTAVFSECLSLDKQLLTVCPMNNSNE